MSGATKKGFVGLVPALQEYIKPVEVLSPSSWGHTWRTSATTLLTFMTGLNGAKSPLLDVRRIVSDILVGDEASSRHTRSLSTGDKFGEYLFRFVNLYLAPSEKLDVAIFDGVKHQGKPMIDCLLANIDAVIAQRGLLVDIQAHIEDLEGELALVDAVRLDLDIYLVEMHAVATEHSDKIKAEVERIEPVVIHRDSKHVQKSRAASVQVGIIENNNTRLDSLEKVYLDSAVQMTEHTRLIDMQVSELDEKIENKKKILQDLKAFASNINDPADAGLATSRLAVYDAHFDALKGAYASVDIRILTELSNPGAMAELMTGFELAHAIEKRSIDAVVAHQEEDLDDLFKTVILDVANEYRDTLLRRHGLTQKFSELMDSVCFFSSRLQREVFSLRYQATGGLDLSNLELEQTKLMNSIRYSFIELNELSLNKKDASKAEKNLDKLAVELKAYLNTSNLIDVSSFDHEIDRVLRVLDRDPRMAEKVREFEVQVSALSMKVAALDQRLTLALDELAEHRAEVPVPAPVEAYVRFHGARGGSESDSDSASDSDSSDEDESEVLAVVKQARRRESLQYYSAMQQRRSSVVFDPSSISASTGSRPATPESYGGPVEETKEEPHA